MYTMTLKKCNIMRVAHSHKYLQHFYSLGNENLQEVSGAKYLGMAAYCRCAIYTDRK